MLETEDFFVRRVVSGWTLIRWLTASAFLAGLGGMTLLKTAQAATALGPVVHLWPKGVPGGTTIAGPEKDTTGPNDTQIAGRPLIRLTNVSDPTLTVYQPAKPTGAAVVVFPGGAYRILALDLEGTEVCQWLNSIDVTCLLLKYRVPSPEGHRYEAPLQDAQRAVGLARFHAKEWGIDPKRIGILGFSAGAHMAANLSNNYGTRTYPAQDEADQQSCRPDFAVIVYPGYLVGDPPDYPFAKELNVTAQTPPTFLVQAEDDSARVENSVYYFLALKKAQVPAEMHLYANGGHGYGLRPTELPVTRWPGLVETWMRTLQILPERP
jgi:acetyl esterase/lipase